MAHTRRLTSRRIRRTVPLDWRAAQRRTPTPPRHRQREGLNADGTFSEAVALADVRSFGPDIDEIVSL